MLLHTHHTPLIIIHQYYNASPYLLSNTPLLSTYYNIPPYLLYTTPLLCFCQLYTCQVRSSHRLQQHTCSFQLYTLPYPYPARLGRHMCSCQLYALHLQVRLNTFAPVNYIFRFQPIIGQVYTSKKFFLHFNVGLG